MKNLELIHIKKKIHTIRGMQVMLDKDLAELYGVETRRLNEQVKRNIERFPLDFMFQLSEAEFKSLRLEFALLNTDNWLSQNATSNAVKMGMRKRPYVFTEQGVAMLSGILKSNIAIKTSIEIMKAFVAMKHFLSQNVFLFQKFQQVDQKLIQYDNNFNKIFKAIEDKSIKPSKGIFYDGQIFDSYKFISDLIKSAKKSLILIDNYIDDTVFTLFTESDVDVIIYTRNLSKKLKLDLEKYNLQYKPIILKEFSKSHDRFMIIDDKDVYHFGASLKDLGKRWFAFSKFNKEVFEMLRRLE